MDLTIWTISIVIGIVILCIENWWLHVLNPGSAVEASVFKNWLQDKYGPKAIPISTLLIGLLGLWMLHLLGFHYDWFPFVSGVILGWCWYDSLAIRSVLRKRGVNGR